MLLSVVIPTYNRASLINSRLYELAQSRYFDDIQILCIDNNSEDSTEEVIRFHNLSYHNQEIQGRCHALQLGINMASCYYTLLLDDDDPINIIELDKAIFLIKAGLRKDDFPDNYFFPCTFKDGWLPGLQHLDEYDWYNIMFYNSVRDMKQICKTSILKNCQPILAQDEMRMPTSWYWLSISKQGGKFTYLNFQIVSKNYLREGMTNSVTRFIYNSPNNHLKYYQLANSCHLDKGTVLSLYYYLRNLTKIIILKCLKILF